MGNIVTIPVLARVKKLILKQHNQAEPVKAEMSNQLGIIIYSVVKDRYKQRSSLLFPESLSEKINVELCYKISSREHRLGKLILINEFYDKYFKQLMFTWITAQLSAGVPALQGIKNFLNHYHIEEEEYSYQSGYRAWLRYKNEEYTPTIKNKRVITS